MIGAALKRGWRQIGMTSRSLPGLNNTLWLPPALITTPDQINAIDGALTEVPGD